MSQKETYIHNLQLSLDQLRDSFLKQNILHRKYNPSITPRALYILIQMYRRGSYLFVWSDLDINLPVYLHTKVIMNYLITLGLIKEIADYHFNMKLHKDTCILTNRGREYLRYALPNHLSKFINFSTLRGRRISIYSTLIVLCSLIDMIMALFIVNGIISIIIEAVLMISSWSILINLFLIFNTLIFCKSKIFFKSQIDSLLKDKGRVSQKDYILFLGKFQIDNRHNDHKYDYISQCLNNIFR